MFRDIRIPNVDVPVFNAKFFYYICSSVKNEEPQD